MYTNEALELRLLLALKEHQHLIPSLQADIFSSEKYRALYDAIKRAYLVYGSVSEDSVSVFYRKPLPQEWYVPTKTDPYPLLDELTKLHKKRALYYLSQQLRSIAEEPDPNLTDVMTLVDEALPAHHRSHDVQSSVDEFLAVFEARHSGAYRWLDTGIEWLSQMIGGEWPRGELTLVTAKSGSGKTALMGASAYSMAQLHHRNPNEGATVALFSLEMPRAQLVARFIAGHLNIDSRIVRTGTQIDGSPLDEETAQRIRDAAREIATYPLHIVDAQGFTADDIISVARSLHVQHHVEAVFVDYLQLLKYSNDSMHYGLGEATKQLLRFVKQYNIALIMAAQVHEQKMTIRDSTDPEKDAALWLHLDVDRDSRDENGMAKATVHILKNRHGPVGHSNVLFDTRRLRFLSPPYAHSGHSAHSAHSAR